MGLISEKKRKLCKQKQNKRAEAATSSYWTTGNFLQCVYSVLVAKNQQKF